MATTIVDEFITILGFKTDLKPGEAFKKVLEDLSKVGKTLSLSLTGAATGLAFFTKNVAENAASNYRYAESLGVSFEKLQEYQDAVQSLGGSAESAASDIEKIAHAALYSGKTLDQELGDLAETFKGMKFPEAVIFGKERLGISEDSIRTLSKGKSAVLDLMEAAKAEGRILPENAGKEAVEFDNHLKKISNTINGVYKNAIAGAFPEIDKLLKRIDNWVKINKELIQTKVKDFTEGFARGISEAITALDKIYQVLKPVITSLFGFTSKMTEADKITIVVKNSLLILAGIITTKVIIGFIGIVKQLWLIVTALNAATAATIKWTISLLANPVVAVTVAIAALVASIALYFQTLSENEGIHIGFIDSLMAVGKSINTFLLVPLNLAIDSVKILLNMLSYLPESMGGKYFENKQKEIESWQKSNQEYWTGVDINKDSKYNILGAYYAAQDRQIEAQGGQVMFGKGGANIHNFDMEKINEEAGLPTGKEGSIFKGKGLFSLQNQTKELQNISKISSVNNVDSSTKSFTFNINSTEPKAVIKEIRTFLDQTGSNLKAIAPGNIEPLGIM